MEEHHIHIRRTARYHTLGDPANADAVWFVLHGYGQLARFFLRKFEGLSSNIFIVAPEAPNRFYVDESHSRVGATWMTREDRQVDIADHVAYLDQLSEHVRTLVPATATLNLLGFSQGVATAVRWTMLGRSAPARLVLWAGTFPPEYDVPALRERLKNVRTELVQGEQDNVVTPELMRTSTALLRAAFTTVQEHVHPGGHDLDKFLLQRIMSVHDTP